VIVENNMSSQDHGLKIESFDFDEALLDSVKSHNKAKLSVYPFPETAVVLGRGSRIKEELSIDDILADGINVYRRKGGGCSVVLDPGNIIISVAIPAEGLKDTKLWFNRCTNWMINGLHSVGIKEVYHDGISDLVIKDRKIAGSAFYRMKGLAYYSIALLANPEMELIEKYLKHPPREPEYRLHRSHKDFLVSLSELYSDFDYNVLLDKLKNTLIVEDLLMY